jgi:peroxiredoxin
MGEREAMTRRLISAAAAGAAALLSSAIAADDEDDCNAQLADFERSYVFGELDHAWWQIYWALATYYLPQYTCPWYTAPEHARYCEGVTDPGDPQPLLDDPDDRLDFDRLIRDVILNPDTYQRCADVLENDAVLQGALANAPTLTSGRRAEYQRLAEALLTSDSFADKNRTTALAPTQEKLLAAFDQVSDWAYCADAKFGPVFSGAYGKTLARYLTRERRVVAYHGLCSPQDLWGFEISYVPARYSAVLIAAHEFGHALADVTGAPQQPQAQSEASATYYGSLFAQCAARKTEVMLHSIDDFLWTDMGSEWLPPGSRDRDFIDCAVDRLSGWDAFFARARAHIDLETGAVPATLAAVNAEIRIPATRAAPRGAPSQLRPSPSQAFAIWRKARPPIDFDLSDLEGRRRRLADYAGKVLILRIWGLDCPPCRDELSSAKSVLASMKRKGVETVVIMTASDGAEALAFFGDEPPDFPILPDPASTIALALGVKALPTTIIVDRRGQYRLVAVGQRDWSAPAIMSELRALAKESP